MLVTGLGEEFTTVINCVARAAIARLLIITLDIHGTAITDVISLLCLLRPQQLWKSQLSSREVLSTATDPYDRNTTRRFSSNHCSATWQHQSVVEQAAAAA